MIEIRGYDTMEAMQADMQASEERANSNLLPAQIRMRDSIEEPVWWFQPYEDFTIWGRCWTENECNLSSLKAGCTQDEAREETASIVEARTRGYLFGMAFSIVEPDGELGSTHVSQAIPVTEDVFNLARAAGWNIDECENSGEIKVKLSVEIERAVREGDAS